MREPRFGRRIGATALIVVVAIAAFAVVGGSGLAGEFANPGNSQYGAGGQYHGKVTICHKGHVTIRVAMVAWLRAHERHGDSMGPCSAAAVKAAKLKAAKLKAAKLKAGHSQSTTHGKGAEKSAQKGKHGPKGQTTTSGATQDTSTETHGQGNGRGNGQGNGHGKNG